MKDFNKYKNIAILDYRASEEISKSLDRMGLYTIPSFRCENVMKGISGHPDITAFSMCGNIVVSSDSYDYYIEKIDGVRSFFDLSTINLIKGYKKLDKKYPNDVPYNICCTKKFAIGNFKYADDRVLKLLESFDIEKIQVSQGYSACSICVVDDVSFITSDDGIYNALKEYDEINILKIREGHIDLEGFEYGFIGGATSSFEDQLLFFGDIDTHPDSDIIKKFIESRGKSYVSLCPGNLTDLGGLRYLY